MTWKVEIKHMRYQGIAQCETCERLHADSTRERCRQHADRNPGHHVRFVVEEVTVYSRPGVMDRTKNATQGRR